MASSIVDDIATAPTIVGSLGVAAAIWKGAQAGLRASVLNRRDLRRRLDKLACGVTAEYVMSLFGPPVFRLALPEVLGNQAEISELIFPSRHVWLQVLISNADDAVRAFSITVRDPKLRYRTRQLTNDAIDVRLGATRFADIRHDPDGWTSRTGARRFSYAESHWFGNPGNYQPYILSYNDAGTGHYDLPHLEGPVPLNGGRLSAEQGYKPAFLEPLPEWPAASARPHYSERAHRARACSLSCRRRRRGR